LRGELDPHDPPATVREAYNQVVAVQLKEMRETLEAIAADIRNSETHMLASAGGPQGPRDPEELTIFNMWETSALVELLERKGILTRQVVLDMIQVLRRREPTAILPR